MVLLEAKSTLLPLSVWAAGDVEVLSERIDRIVGEAAEQFDGTMRLIEEGHLQDMGVDPSHIQNYLPLVVTLETMPNDFMAYRLVEQRMRRQVALEHPKAKPLQLADVGDIGSCPKRSWRLRWLPVDSCYAATSSPSTGGVPSSSRCALSIQRSL